MLETSVETLFLVLVNPEVVCLSHHRAITKV